MSSDLASKPVPRWRWWVHFSLLTLCPMVALLRPAVVEGSADKPLLPPTVSGLLETAAANLAVFGAIVGIALFFSRAGVDDLLIRWRRGIRPILLGAAYSVLLRVALLIMVMGVMIVIIAARGAPAAQAIAEKMRPETTRLISPSALTGDPVYLGLCLTLVSFVVAGLREELWRIGVICGALKLLEPGITGRMAQILAVLFSSVLFGLAHFPQGWGAIAMTTVLGLGFSLMMIFHRSIWEAVFAHGFFDATTFLMIYLLVKYFPGKIPGF